MEQQMETTAAATDDMGAAVEAQMGKIMTELGDALGVLLTALGVRSGLVGRAGRGRPADRRPRSPAGSASSRRWSGSGYGPRPPVDT